MVRVIMLNQYLEDKY